MKNALYLFVAILCFACKQPQSPKPTLAQLIKQEVDSIFLNELEGYNIPYSRDLSDSNQLFFMSRGSFDTTFIFHIRKTKNDVRGVVYMIGRRGRETYYDLSEDATENDYAYPFEGYGFKLDSKQWQELIAQADHIIKDTAAIRKRYENVQPTDGTSRTMLYKGLIINGTNGTDETFEHFTDYLKDRIIAKLNAKRYDSGL